jgi:hypothetical protein
METAAPAEGSRRRRTRYGVLGYQVRQATATIASGQSLSGAVYPGGRLLRIFVPAGTLGSKLLVHAGINESGTTFGPSRGLGGYALYDFAAGDAVEVGGLDGCGAVKIQTVASDGTTPVTQTGSITLTLIAAAD